MLKLLSILSWYISCHILHPSQCRYTSGHPFRKTFALCTVQAKQPRDISRSSNQERNGSRRRIRSLLSTIWTGATSAARCWIWMSAWGSKRLILVWVNQNLQSLKVTFVHSKYKHLYENSKQILSKHVFFSTKYYQIPWVSYRLQVLNLTWVIRITGSRWIVIIQTYHAQGRMFWHPWCEKLLETQLG